MSTTVKTGWLKDKEGNKFAPKTLASQVQTSDGVLLEDKIQADLDAAKADWNQNDETALGYVKNRTHWAEAVYEIIVPETTETAEIAPLNDQLFDYTSYIVIVDGVEYQCTPYLNIRGEISLGDSRLYDDNSNPIDAPFYAVSYFGSNQSSMSEKYMIDVYYPDSEIHTIEIKKLTGELNYHVLDENYIPKTIARTSDINDAINATSITALTDAEIDEICNNTIEYAEGKMF